MQRPTSRNPNVAGVQTTWGVDVLGRVSTSERFGDASAQINACTFAANKEMGCDFVHGPVSRSCVTGCVSTRL